MHSNSPCSCSDKRYREVITTCPCGCGRWFCRRCIKALKRAFTTHALSDAIDADQPRPIGPQGSPENSDPPAGAA